MGIDFYRTVAGRHFYEAQLPRLINALEKIGKELEQLRQGAENEEES